MFEPIVDTKASPDIDAKVSELTVAWRLDQMRRQEVRSRELIAELRRQIDAKNVEIRDLAARLAASSDDRSRMRALTVPGIAKIQLSNPIGRLHMSVSWIAQHARLRISRGANGR